MTKAKTAIKESRTGRKSIIACQPIDWLHGQRLKRRLPYCDTLDFQIRDLNLQLHQHLLAHMRFPYVKVLF
jgi:hypothetical protein